MATTIVKISDLRRRAGWAGPTDYESEQCDLDGTTTAGTALASNFGGVVIWDKSSGSPVEQYLQASDGFSGNYFGRTLSLHGNDLLVGAKYDNEVGANDGAAYFYSRTAPGASFSGEQKLTSPLVTRERFGTGVAIGADIAVICEINGTGSWASSVHIARKNPGTGLWALDQRLDVVGGLANLMAHLPESTRICKRTSKRFIVGEPGHSYSMCRVKIYRDDGPGAVVLEQDIPNPDSIAGDGFGDAVDIYDDVAVVWCFAPKAFVFTRSGTTWSLAQRLTIPAHRDWYEFGRAAAIDKERGILLLGCSDYDPGVSEGWLGVYQGAPGTFALIDEYFGEYEVDVNRQGFGRGAAIDEGVVAVSSKSYGILDLTKYADTDPPFVNDCEPGPGDVDCDPSGPLAFSVHDLEMGVDPDETVVTINGVIVWENDAPANGWIGSRSTLADGYHYTLTPPEPFPRVVMVEVDAADLAVWAPNTCHEAWAFLAGAYLREDQMGDTIYLANDRDIEMDSVGRLRRDATPGSRCLFRLLCRRGEYWADPELGSRFHTIQTLKEGKRVAKTYAIEALQPLVDEGVITEVQVGEVEVDHQIQRLTVPIDIIVPDGNTVPLGYFLLGSGL